MKVRIIFLTLFFFMNGALLSAQESFPYLGMVTADKVNLRAGPNKNFESLTFLNKTAQIVVLEKSYSWFRIKLPAYARSFIFDKYIKDIGGNVGQVTAGKVNVRANANLNSSVLCQVKKGNLVRLIQRQDEWYKIEPPDHCSGWVEEEFIGYLRDEVPPPKIVEAPTRNVYKLKRIADKKAKEEAARLAEEEKKRTVVATGTIQLIQSDQSRLGRFRHFLVVDQDQMYLLKSFRSVLDGFQGQKVQLEGSRLVNDQVPYPVLLVKKITLIM